jgi:hypothetical protein
MNLSTSETITNKNGRKKGGGQGGAINHSSSILVNCNEKHKPQFTKHRKNKGQFKRKKNHWSERRKK